MSASESLESLVDDLFTDLARRRQDLDELVVAVRAATNGRAGSADSAQLKHLREKALIRIDRSWQKLGAEQSAVLSVVDGALSRLGEGPLSAAPLDAAASDLKSGEPGVDASEPTKNGVAATQGSSSDAGVTNADQIGSEGALDPATSPGVSSRRQQASRVLIVVGVFLIVVAALLAL